MHLACDERLGVEVDDDVVAVAVATRFAEEVAGASSGVEVVVVVFVERVLVMT